MQCAVHLEGAATRPYESVRYCKPQRARAHTKVLLPVAIILDGAFQQLTAPCIVKPKGFGDDTELGEQRPEPRQHPDVVGDRLEVVDRARARLVERRLNLLLREILNRLKKIRHKLGEQAEIGACECNRDE